MARRGDHSARRQNQQHGDQPLEHQPTPRGQRRKRPQPRRLHERRGFQQLCSLRQRLEEHAVLCHLIRAETAEDHGRVREPPVGQQSHPEERSAHIVGREHALPNHRQREGGRQEPRVRCSRGLPPAPGPTAPARSQDTSTRAGSDGCRRAATPARHERRSASRE